jgi:diguanylate cyclase (GGDEF)-like protein
LTAGRRLLAAAAVVLAGVAYVLLPERPAAAAYIAVAGTATAVMLARGRWRGEPALAWWWLLWAGVGLRFAGDLAWYAAWFAPPFEAWVELLYLPSYLAFGWGLWGLTRTSITEARRVVALDVVIVVTAAAWLVWQLAILPVRDAPEFVAILVLYVHPVLDVVLLAAVARVLTGRRRTSRSLLLLGGAFVALLVADLGYTVLVQAAAYRVALPVDLAWLAFYVLVAAAAVHPSAARHARRSAETHLLVLREGLVASAVLVVPGYQLAAFWLDVPPVGLGGTLAAKLLMGLVMVRLLLTLGGQALAHRRLQRRARQQAAVARLGQMALASRDLASLQSAVSAVVCEALGATACTVEPPSSPCAPHPEPVAVDGASVCVRVTAHDSVLAVLRVALGRPATLEDDDRSFLQAVANVLAAAIADVAAQQRLEHQALHDPLTGLPNRTLLLDRIGQALQRHAQVGGQIGVLFADLDRFKLVNDGLGHSAGDRLLAAVAQRMRGALRPSDTVARLGGDEFAVLCEPLGAEADATAVAERLLAALSAPLSIDGTEVVISASIGATVGRPGDSPEALVRDADLAMYRAKSLGRNRAAVYDDGLQQAAQDRLHINTALRHALPRDELRLSYQPEVDLRSGRVVLVEALMRWDHPTLGTVPPSVFIPLAEESGLIAGLGEWALRGACATAAGWTAAGGTAPAVAVNLSPRQLGQPDLCGTVADALRASGLPAEQLWLEVTESAVMHEPGVAVATLERLKALGVRIAMDDFGTGYSSLAQLKAFPLDALKIDRSFVSGLGDDIQDYSIVAATIELARALELVSIAEGVETAQQLDALRRLGCDIAQGYYWSRPVPAPTLARLLAADHRGHGRDGRAGAATARAPQPTVTRLGALVTAHLRTLR